MVDETVEEVFLKGLLFEDLSAPLDDSYKTSVRNNLNHPKVHCIITETLRFEEETSVTSTIKKNYKKAVMDIF